MTEKLNHHGLDRVGRWVLSGHKTVAHLISACSSGINYEIPPEWRTRRDVVYALVFKGSIRYVGETSVGIASRFNGYRYGNPLVSDTDNRIKLAITQTLVEGHEVEIWACCPFAELKLPNGQLLKVPASKPLEEHLIALIGPDLNLKSLGAVPVERQSV